MSKSTFTFSLVSPVSIQPRNPLEKPSKVVFIHSLTPLETDAALVVRTLFKVLTGLLHSEESVSDVCIADVGTIESTSDALPVYIYSAQSASDEPDVYPHILPVVANTLMRKSLCTSGEDDEEIDQIKVSADDTSRI
ncbi:hypothetical protein PS15p_206613 [Mucor circinelloides]